MKIRLKFPCCIKYILFLFLVQFIFFTYLYADAWDPTDDNAVNGTVITPTATTQSDGPHDLSATDTTDWFKISMTAGTIYYFSFTNYSNNCNAYLYSDSAGTNQVASSSSGDPFNYNATSSQIYYLKLKFSYNSWSGYLNYRSTNTAPVLSWTGETNYTSDGLNPETGSPSTIFTCRVKYTDADDDAPESYYPRVVISTALGASWQGTKTYIMNEVDVNDTSYSDGKLFTYSTNLSSGTDYIYYFQAYDKWNTLAIGATYSIDAPDVSTPQLFAIAGYVKDNSGTAINGVLVCLTGADLRFSTTTATGYYKFTGISEGGNFTVTPTKTNYTFSPESKSYSNLSANQTDQNFTGIAIESTAKGTAGWTTRLTGSRAEYTAFDWSSAGIVYSLNNENGVDLYIMSADGSNKKQITNDEYVELGAKFIFGQSKIIYVRANDTVLNYSICTMNNDGSGKTVIYTSTSTMEDIKVSPDGTKIAFIKDSNRLSVININGTGYMYLAECWAGYSWAPDSNKIVYYFSGDINIITSTGGAPNYLCDGSFPDWSATNKIVYCYGSSPSDYLYTINPDGTGNIQLTTTAGYYYYKFKWSPDGSKVCYLGYNYYADSNSCYIINSDGTGNIKIVEDYDFFAFSPTNDRIGCGSQQNIYTIKTDATNKKNLTNNTLSYYFNLVDAGQKIIYNANYEDREELKSIDVNGKNETLIETSTTSFLSEVLSPDGTKVAYSYLYNGRYYVKVKDIYGNSVYSVDSASPTYYIGWSQDNKKITFILGTELVISNFSSLIKLVSFPDFVSYSVPSFSSDGTKVVFFGTISGVSGTYIINSDGTSKQKIAIGSYPIYSPSGSKVAYYYNGDLWIYENGTNTQITKDGNIWFIWDIGWSPDATKVVNYDRVIDTVTGMVYQLTKWGIDWYGSKITYVDESLLNRKIVISNPDGSERQQLTPASYVFGYDNSRFSLDGTKVVCNYGGDIYLVNLYSSHQAKLEQDHILPVNNVINPIKGDICKVYYSVPQAGHITIKLYTIDGVFIKTLVDKDVVAGTYSENWYGKNSEEEVVASGIYYIHIEGPGFKQTKKICVVK
ncbi:MAG: hypothetical protein PHE88_04785 [Elusimicrobia bacterium]|nr:hypothetical protein [Elusimicrobiota bacterium]